MSRNVTRLFEQFVPEHYDIDLEISEDKKSFTGSLTLRGKKVGRPSQRITLHQKDLKLDNPTLTFTDKKGATKNIAITRAVLQKSRDEVRFHTDDTLYPGSYTIKATFSGNITKNMEGVYPCFFKDGDQDKQLIATQFESHHAREVFPCIDEPEAKATFTLSLTHAKNEVALSNTKVASTEARGDRQQTAFETTPIMSTYLLAFVVGELEYKEAKNGRGVRLRTYATKDQVAHTQFALDVAVKCLDFYEDYFDIPFPLDKCDLVALPDFASGAMENWGLITFREQALLSDEEHTSLSTKQWVAMVVAHELTHQWFGNLVTMRWWTDLWLNEGFASWMEYLALAELYPEWDMWTQFAVDEQQSALKADALEHTHPVEVPVKHPDEIRTIFDIISYQKGSSVIHMLHDYLGADAFRDGLRHYLKKHAYKNTDTIDLWHALEDETGKPVKDFMGAWTSQTGFPLIEVSVAGDHLKISQSRFVSNPTSSKRNEDTLWPIPLLSDGVDRATVHKKRTNVPFKKNPPIKLNNGQTGFYRVDYTHELQQKQLQALDKGTVSAVDRMGLLADGFEVTKAGYQPVTEYLDLLEHYASENSLPVWEIMAGSIGAIRSTLSKTDADDSLRDTMKPFIQSLTNVQYDRLSWNKHDKEPHLDSLLRPVVIGLAAGADRADALEIARQRYDEKMSGGSIDPDLRGIIYSSIARHGSKTEYKALLNLYKNSNSSDEKLSICAAMTSFEQPELHSEVLELIKSDTVRMQDISYWIVYSFMNRHARKATWQWFKDNWDWLKKHLGNDLSFARMPLYAARSFADEAFLKDYQEFFSTRMEPMLERTYQQGLETTQTNTAWRTRDADKALKWFKQHNNPGY